MVIEDILRNRWMVAWLGIVLFALYLHGAGPGLVPYRDAGEMATSVPTLGILHPTSYPFYSISGNLFGRIGLGNPAYRLNVFSGLAMAAMWVFFFAALCRRVDPGAALMTTLVAAVSYQYWTHALVSEMYALNCLFVAAIWFLVDANKPLLAAFVFGVGLTNRSDLLLSLPAFLVLLPTPAARTPRRPWVAMTVLVATGMTLYLYLPLRASQHPWLNWNNPSTLSSFFRSLLRKGYGGTLDLLSQSYGMGENFIDELILYGRHLWVDFAYAGAPLALYGLFKLWTRDRRYAIAVLIGFMTTGPLFIFLGNLPQNPHAVAIMQAAYLVPDFFFVICCAAGFSAVLERAPRHKSSILATATVAVIAWTAHGYAAVNKRNNFFAIDFISNINHTAPVASVIVGRSDVPLFSLFYSHWMDQRLAGRIPIAQGLANSLWYQEMLQLDHPDLIIRSLKTPEEWSDFARRNPNRLILATQDLEWPENASVVFNSFGILSRYVPERSANDLKDYAGMDAFYRFRGDYRYGESSDFFVNELIEEYAKAWLARARELSQTAPTVAAEMAFRRALALKPDMPYAALQLAYVYYLRQDFTHALHYYSWAVDLFRQMNEQAVAWRSLPELRAGVRADWAQTVAQQGAIEERLGHSLIAQKAYEQALEINPQCADAQYYEAVLYWKQGNWQEVVNHLQRLAQDHPADPRWKTYLPEAMRRLK